MMAIQTNVINAEDGVQWGPSGGSNRETQGRRQPQRPWMFGKERSAAFEQSSYSRGFIKEWQNVRVQQEDEWNADSNKEKERNMKGATVKKEEANAGGVKKEEENDGEDDNMKLGGMNSSNNNNSSDSDSSKLFMPGSAKRTTEMDPTLITARFIKNPNCPRNLFSGKCFFLNSCDADPLISVYQLEKIIRFLGGVTAMGVSTRVDYILTQHLSSAKEAKLLRDFDEVRDLDTNGTRRIGAKGASSSSGLKTVTNSGGSAARPMPKCVHPHFVLDCCEAGRIVPLDKYLTTPKCSVFSAASDQKTEKAKQPHQNSSAKNNKNQKLNNASDMEVIELE